MARIAIASTNPVKVQAIRRAFERVFPGEAWEVIPVVVASGVGHQPLSDAETLVGAQVRAERAAALVPEADYWAGIEGGVHEMEAGLAAFAWVVIRARSGQGQGRTGTFFLPPAVAGLVRQGVELGEADDRVFGRSNSKQENGAVGILTGDAIDRAALYEHAVVLALIPFRNEALYRGGSDEKAGGRTDD